MRYFLPLSLFFAACAVDPHSEEAHGMKMMALLEKFDRFDYNGDGLLTRREIEQGVRESDVGGVDKKEIAAAMKYYDVNKDGFVSRWEAERVIDLPVPDLH